MRIRFPLPLIAAILTLSRGPVCAQARLPTEVRLPGGEAGIGFDDLGFSAMLGRVLVPGGRSGNLDLVDPATRGVTVVGGFSSQIRFGGGHGEGATSVDEGAGYLFATDRTSVTVNVIAPTEKKIVATARLAAAPDYVRYVDLTRELWVTEPDNDRIEIFRLEGSKPPRPVHAQFVAVKGGPESLVIDGSRGRAYTHLWEAMTLAIDLKSRAIVERWPNGCSGSRGIALDRSRGFLFAGCAEGKAVVLDVAHGGRQLGTARSGTGVDIIDYDANLGHLYLPGAGSQTLAILGVSDAGGLTLLGTLPTAPSAHCVVSDQKGNAYVCEPRKGRLLVLRDPYPASVK